MSQPDQDTSSKASKEEASRLSRSPVADLEHPWLGLESFYEETRAYFFGRDAEIDEIHLRLRSNPLLVLYGRSGLGKTSILNAGLIPRLRGEAQKPALHRLTYKDGDPSPVEQLFYLLFYVHEQSGIRRYIEGISRAAQWWQTFLTTSPFRLPGDFASRLWLRLHWRKELPNITQLILDQFEEVFTVGAQRAGAENEVRDALAILLQSSIPDPIVRLIAERDDFLDYFDSDSTPVRVLLALRDDYVYALNRWKRSLPSLGQNNFELRALRGPAALDAVFKPGALRCRYRGEVSQENKADTGLPPIVAEETAERIVRFVARKGDEVPIAEIEAVPPILSLLCRELNERRFTASAGTADAPTQQITFSESDTDVETIVKSFYERCITGRPDGVRTFIEEELVSYSGARLAQDEKSILSAFEKGWRIPGATNGQLAPGYGDPVRARTCLEELLNERLLTSVTRGENRSYELIHDLLAGVVEKSRLTREALAQAERLLLGQAAQRRKQRLATAVACALAVALIVTLYGGYYAFVQEHTDYYREFTKRHGFPVGIFQISEREALRLPVSFRFVHKGVVRDGWKFHWKPAFRVEAVNGFLELTTNHSVFPYLWKGELESKDEKDKKPDLTGRRLGLATVCKWEFVSTREDQIIYERALDRVGHMVYGLVYSPSGSGRRGTGLARFVGADGFPQFQRRSAAEYVEIHYDAKGWEDHVMYLDGKNRPGTGPDGAFGQRIIHNEQGQITEVLSLDKSGDPMIDNAGNCGMQAKYDKRGYDVEARSVGPDEKLIPVKDGFVIRKNDYDEFGRLHSSTYFGAKGEPVLLKESGCHGWEIEYDDNGNRRVETCLGLDGKPALDADGYVTTRMGYDSHGNLSRMAFYDAKNQAVLNKKEGYHGWEANYDEKGNETAETYLGLDEKPTSIADGYARVRMVCDERGNVVRMTFYDVNREPVLSKQDRCHGWQVEYDKSGNQTIVTYLGLDEKPAPNDNGYATIRKTYDLRGNLTRVTVFGGNNEPVLLKKQGYHGWQAEYDDHGNQTLETYLGLDQKPASVADGYATIRMAYDARGKLIRKTFHDVKGEPVVSKENGYHAWEAEYDEKGNKTAETYLGLDGERTCIADGYATVRMVYDASGKMIRKTFHGANGAAVLSKKDSYHGWEAEYDEKGNKTAETYLGLDEKPMRMDDGYATMKSAYDARGNVIRQRFYGIKGEPVRHKDGYYGREAQYDEKGNRIVVTYLDLNGKPMRIDDGYATLKSAYDARGNIIRQTFHGVKGEPAGSEKDGYHGWEGEYDEQGNQTIQTYIGLDEKPMRIDDGYASLRWAYDARGNMIRQTFHDVKGEPAGSEKDGYHGWEGEYDEQGNQTVQTYIGMDEKPMRIDDGYAIIKAAYDARGKLIRKAFHDVKGEPVVSKENGYHAWEAEYDKKGSKTAETYLGLDKKPTCIVDGYATVRMAYDACGNVIRQTFDGANGEAVLSKKNGYHGWEAEYDEHGNRTVMTYLGLKGKPMRIPDGYATKKVVYDARGNKTQMRLYGVNGERALSKEIGYHGWEAEYDENGNETAKVYLGLDGKPLLSQTN
jgi:uncharacterized protein CbrC (UPF0167 family)